MRHHSTRTARLRMLAAAACLALAGAALAACAPPASGGSARGGDAHDGTLTLGVVGGSTDTLDPYASVASPADDARQAQLYEGLTRHDAKGELRPALAKSITPNADNTVWTVRLRPHVKLHDGSTFDADDVIRSIRHMLDPDTAFQGASLLDFVDPDGLTKVNDRTVKLTLKHPYGPLRQAFSETAPMAGWKDDKPVGTGPFTVKDFTAGQQSTFERFDGYWGEKPDFETLKIVDFHDNDAIINALRGGQVDVSSSVPFSHADTLEKTPGIHVLASKNTMFHMSLNMRTDVPPFDDPKMREAMKLVLNRKQIVDNAFDGYATVGNDYSSNTSSCPAPDVPQRTQDLAKAKKLFAEAGVPHLKVDLVTDGGMPGMTEMAQVVSAQAAKAGVTVTLKKLDTGSFLNKWMEWPFFIDYNQLPYLDIANMNYTPAGENNSTHFDDPEFNALAKKLYLTADQGEQCATIAKMQKIMWERGGVIFPINSTVLTAYRDTVHGLKPDVMGRAAYRFAGVSVAG